MEVALPIRLGLPRIAWTPPRPFVDWLICWVLLPNAAFCAMWLIGGPPRYPEIFASGAVGLVVRRSGFAIKFAAFLITMIYSVLGYVSSLFNLSVSSIVHSAKFLIELRPGASLEYMVLTLVIGLTLLGGWRLLRRCTAFESPFLLLAAILAVSGFAGVDTWMGYGMRGSYKRLVPDGAPFSSGTSQAGLELVAGNRNVLIVAVEALGFPRDPALQAKLLQRWRQSDVGARYSVSAGSTPFFGSTTNGEVRELCGRWGDYPELMDRAHPECLPARFAERGYQTTAVHSFDGAFFDRDTWYRNIGFQTFLARDALVNMGAAACPGVFPGACDRDVPAILAKRLKAPGRQFVYWLTVNSHLPVAVDKELRTDRCDEFDARLADQRPMTCRLFNLWSEVDNALADVLTASDLPPTDVLIVGDHAPPFFDRAQRTMFHGDRVPWILLRHKDAVHRRSGGAAAASAQTVQ